MLFNNNFIISKKVISLFWIFILKVNLLQSCSTTANEILLKLNDEQYNKIILDNNIGYFKNPVLGNDSLISMLDYTRNVVYVYNYHLKKNIDSFDVKKLDHQYLFDYEIIDTDKILVEFNTTYLGDYHDSALVIMNKQKQITKVFSFEGTPVPLYDENNPKEYRKTNWWFVFNNNIPLYYNHEQESVIVTLTPFHTQNCTSVKELQSSILYKLRPDQASEPLNYSIPTCSDRCYNKDKFIIRPYGDYDHEGNLLLGFWHNDSLFYKSQSHYVHLKLYNYLEQLDLHISNMDVTYDPYTHTFWWLIKIINPITIDNQEYKNISRYYLVNLDKNLNIISEGLLPEHIGPYFIPLKEGLLVQNISESDKNGQKIFEIVKPQIQTIDINNLNKELERIAQVNKLDIKPLVQELIKNTPEKKKLLLIPEMSMPPNYYKLLVETIISNSAQLGNYSIHIFTRDVNKIDERLKSIVHIHNLTFLKEHYVTFMWPKIIETNDDTLNNLIIKDYPSNQANHLKIILSNSK